MDLRCVKTHKKCHETFDAAMVHLKSLTATLKQKTYKEPKLNCYKCPMCHYWHVGNKR